MQVKKLMQTNDALEENVRKKIELIESFEGKILNLELQLDFLSCKEVMHCKETQTEESLDLKCDECNFEAEHEKELGWHMGRSHGWSSEANSVINYDAKADKMDISLLSTDPRTCEKCDYEAEDLYDYDAHTWDIHDDEEGDQSPSISCQFCENRCANLKELMEHKKRQHQEKINVCWNYSTGNCQYGDEKCWFLHRETNETRIECTQCEKKHSKPKMNV